MDQFLIHLPEFYVTMCKKCQYAILPSQIDAHFAPQIPRGEKKATKRPHGLSNATRERIKQDVAQIEGLIPNPGALQQSEFPFPPPTVAPIPALGSPKTLMREWVRCTFKIGEEECRYICCSLQQMREHCGKSKEQGGRPRKVNPQPTPSAVAGWDPLLAIF
jgi:hypothetical protein